MNQKFEDESVDLISFSSPIIHQAFETTTVTFKEKDLSELKDDTNINCGFVSFSSSSSSLSSSSSNLLTTNKIINSYHKLFNHNLFESSLSSPTTTLTLIVREGTSIRPLISFASNNTAVTLEDVPAPTKLTILIETNSIIPEDQKSNRSI
ncbi:hypothetical protein PPACK8108_LOCUS5508 [Phakopsora pachyrhizi]|uniref:Uncharacterized protein n=1 Tax=Phakopsora pachyrhizi TaxID=170000 RepID=A0AAV0AP06_PHAPC|nr:hypothetical protein PPACK8108_LOCUS5508 [Phakopsora pachyrhizi]